MPAWLSKLVLVYTVFSCAIPLSANALDVGAIAPDFSISNIDGGAVSLSALKGKVVYLDFWASWCGPCKHTLPWMNDIQKRFGDRGFQVLAINLDDSVTSAKEAVSTLTPTFSIGLDPEKIVVSKYQPPKMPTSFLIDKLGSIVMVHSGFHDGDQDELARKIEELLG